MKKLLLSLLVCLFAIPMFSQNHLEFKGVEMKGNVYTFVRKLKSKGMRQFQDRNYSSTTKSLLFEGTLAGDECMCSVHYTSSMNPAIVIVVFNDHSTWTPIKTTYTFLKQLYTEKYPDAEVISKEEIGDYYNEGEEMESLLDGELYYHTFFYLPEGEIELKITKSSTEGFGYVGMTFKDKQNYADLAEDIRESKRNDI